MLILIMVFRGFSEMIKFPLVRMLGDLISTVTLVKFIGIRIVHISLTNSAILNPICLSSVATSIIGTFMVTRRAFMSWLFAFSISMFFLFPISPDEVPSLVGLPLEKEKVSVTAWGVHLETKEDLTEGKKGESMRPG